MRGVADLRRELSVRAQEMALANKLLHELTAGETPSVIFGCNESRQHGNFYPASYRNICAHPDWRRRLTKIHTASHTAGAGATWRWKELDCANSSDALLMNIFCSRRALRNPALSSMLGIPTGLVPQFGFRPRIPLRSGKTDRTEIFRQLTAIHGSARSPGVQRASRHAPPQQVGGDRTEPIQTSHVRKTMSLLWSTHRAATMSSIKRDVKKKAPPPPEDRGCFSKSSPLCFVTSEDVRLVMHSHKLFSAAGGNDRVCKTRQAGRCRAHLDLGLALAAQGDLRSATEHLRKAAAGRDPNVVREAAKALQRINNH